MAEDKRLYLTTPVFYPNDKPHLGHVLTVTIADCIKRYHTSIGYKCLLTTGTDEHGEKLVVAAKKAGMEIEEFINLNVSKFKELWELIGISYDKFIRTSNPDHKSLVRKIFKQFEDDNQIFFDKWKGWYCSACEENYSIRAIGKDVSCKLGHPLTMHDEQSYFLRTSSFKLWLSQEYKDNDMFIYPSHYKKEMINNFVNDLDDLSISRENLDWGVKVPGRDNHAVYVWFDALISYLTALNYNNCLKNSSTTFSTYWKNPNSKVVHLIGKEICRFHSIYWPIMLKNLGLRLFDSLIVHGWLLMDQEKMSKSKKNVIDPFKVLEILPREALRFYLMKINFLNDSSVSWDDIFFVYNSCLVNTYGNLISRFYGIMSKKFNYQLPDKFAPDLFPDVERLNIDLDNFLNNELEELILNYSYFVIVEKIFELFRSTGKIIEKAKAWTLEATDPSLQNLMIFIYRLLTIGTWALSPILIDTAPRLFDLFNLNISKINIDYFKKDKWFVKKTINPLEENLFKRIYSED